MSDEEGAGAAQLARERIEEIQTKIGYIVIGALFAADAAGTFAAEIPALVFVIGFIALLVVDAAT